MRNEHDDFDDDDDDDDDKCESFKAERRRQGTERRSRNANERNALVRVARGVAQRTESVLGRLALFRKKKAFVVQANWTSAMLGKGRGSMVSARLVVRLLRIQRTNPRIVLCLLQANRSRFCFSRIRKSTRMRWSKRKKNGKGKKSRRPAKGKNGSDNSKPPAKARKDC